VYPDLKIEFSGIFDSDEESNKFTLNMYNLSNDTISKINKGLLISVNAGYNNNIGNILTGIIKKVETNKSNVNIITEIEIQGSSNNWMNAVISKTFTETVKASEILKNITSLVGMEIGKFSLKNDTVYQNGYTVFGRLKEAIKSVVENSGSKLIINNGKIDIISKNNENSGMGFLLNSGTGLIETPKKVNEIDNDAEYSIQMLMNWHIRPYSVINVNSSVVNGLFFVLRGQYNTDFTISAEIKRIE